VAQSYLDEMAAFREWETSRRLGDSVTEDGLASLMEDKGLMEDASHIYSASCVKCHGVKGEGKIGPNLTDAHWLRGSGSLLDIYNLVNKGGPNGMPAWGRKLRPIQLQKVVAFVGSMRFTMVPGKAPQGTRVEFRSEAPAETDTPEAEGGGETEAMPTVVRANPERGEGGSEQGARRQGRAKR